MIQITPQMRIFLAVEPVYPYSQPRIGGKTGSGYAARHVNSACPWPPSQRWASVRRPG